MVISNFGQIWKLIIVNIHGEGFFNLLFYVVVYHCVALTRAGSSKHDGRTKNIYNINPSVPFPALIDELCRQVDGILVLHEPCLLHETLVGGIEYIFHEVVFRH